MIYGQNVEMTLTKKFAISKIFMMINDNDNYVNDDGDDDDGNDDGKDDENDVMILVLMLL